MARLIALLGMLAALFAAADARAERRVALVIGNSQYANAPALRNPKNDATDMAARLRALGFEVTFGADLDQRAFARVIDQFARTLDGADVALFYYAGHGLQINDKNYLVSVDAQLTSEFLVGTETIELDAIVRLMESRVAVNLVFLDACRNNPMAEELRRNLTSHKRSVALGRGLAKVEPTGRDTMIAFAAAPGQEAADGGGGERNSPFTAALLRHIGTPQQEVSVMFKQVTADVRRDTRNAQRPQQVSDMSRTFYFAKAEAPNAGGEEPEVSKKDQGIRGAPLPQPQPQPQAQPQAQPQLSAQPAAPDERALDVAFWSAAQSANECRAMRAYLARFPNGVFVELAKLGEARLCTPPTVAEPVPVTPPAPLPPAQTAAVQPPAAPIQSPIILTPAPPPAATPPAAPPAAIPAATPPAAAPPATTPESTPVVTVPQPPAGPPQPLHLPQRQRQAAAGSGVDPTRDNRANLVPNIQRELVRVGCASGEASGQWTADTQEAVRRFNEAGRWRFDTSLPSPGLLSELRRAEGTICQSPCAEGVEFRNGRCMEMKPAPRRRYRAERHQQRQERQERRERRRQERGAVKESAGSDTTVRGRGRAARGSNGSNMNIGGRRCRLVPRTGGGTFNGDTITVCD